MSKEKSEIKKTILKLRDVRLEKGMSINTLAEKAGIDYQRIGRLERGETQMTIDILYRLAKVLQVPLSQLLNENDVEGVQGKFKEDQGGSPNAYLIPEIYKTLESLCSKHGLVADNQTKVHIISVIFKAIQDIHSSVKDDADLVQVFFYAFDAIFERLFLTRENLDFDD